MGISSRQLGGGGEGWGIVTPSFAQPLLQLARLLVVEHLMTTFCTSSTSVYFSIVVSVGRSVKKGQGDCIENTAIKKKSGFK